MDLSATMVQSYIYPAFGTTLPTGIEKVMSIFYLLNGIVYEFLASVLPTANKINNRTIMLFIIFFISYDS